MSVLTDIDILLDKMDPNLFPGISSDIEVHSGFSEAHARSEPLGSFTPACSYLPYDRTATVILAAVQEALKTGGVNNVTLVGHSLG